MLLKSIITARTSSDAIKTTVRIMLLWKIIKRTINAWTIIITTTITNIIMMMMMTMMMMMLTKGQNPISRRKSSSSNNNSTRSLSSSSIIINKCSYSWWWCCCWRRWKFIMMMMVLILMLNGCKAKIALMPHTNHSAQTLNAATNNNDHGTKVAESATPLATGFHCVAGSKLTARHAVAKIIDETQSMQLLALDSSLHAQQLQTAANRQQQQLRLLLRLNLTTPLAITFSQHVERQIYFNRTNKLNFGPRSEQHRTLVLPCALRGDYDILLHGITNPSIKVDARIVQPKAQWSLLSHVHRVNIRNQNRVRKRELIVKWDRSKFDFYAVHYCLVFNIKHAYKNFCTAVEDNYLHVSQGNCAMQAPLNYIWSQAAQRVRKIDPGATNVICTGSRTRQVLKGLAPNLTYYLDIFGVHTRRQNLTFHMASTVVHYKRHHPHILRANQLSTIKISEMHGNQVFSYKIPSASMSNNLIKSEMVQLRYLILPCGGSEIDAKLLKQRKIVGSFTNIYRPTYIALPALRGDRYIIRFMPSNEDEILRANKVTIAVSTLSVFSHLPELPENITVFDVRTRCKSTTIAWYHSPDTRPINYCIIVLNIPQRNRSLVDYTNYCMDFGKRITRHADFHSIRCMEKSMNSGLVVLETHTILNLLPGENYLIYVTANLSEGKTLPYQSLRIRTSAHCGADNEFDDLREQNAYY